MSEPVSPVRAWKAAGLFGVRCQREAPEMEGADWSWGVPEEGPSWDWNGIARMTRMYELEQL